MLHLACSRASRVRLSQKLVTGANSGLGYEVALQLARSNASVILGCRDISRCEAAALSIRGADVRTMALDLNDLRSVATAAAHLNRRLRSLDLLVLNAGVAAQFPTTLTMDGVESTFQANYLGHFALTTKLLPLLKKTARRRRRPSRVVHLTSGAHRGAPAEGVPLTLEQINGPMGAYARYGMAKLASLAFSNELARRVPTSLLLSNAVHPGVVATAMLRMDNFASMLGPIIGRLAWLLAQLRNLLFAYSPRTASLSVLYAAVAEEVEAEGLSGQLIVPIATRWAPHHPMASNNATFGRALWQFSEKLCRK